MSPQLQQFLRRDVTELASRIGERNITRYGALLKAATFIENSFADSGHQVHRRNYEAAKHSFDNLEIEIRGSQRPDDIVVVGAHYDSAKGSPGANDNGSGVAALLALAREICRGESPSCTLRLVAFVNEERPFLRTRKMGSRVYARGCRERGENIVGMLSLETIGYCSGEVGSQKLSVRGRLLPRRGDFIAMVANRPSRELLQRASTAWQADSDVPLRTIVLPAHFPGAWSSDHWSFWKEGFPGIMLTDTAPLRYPHYHRKSDLPDRVEFDWLEKVTRSIIRSVSELVGSDGSG